VLRLSVAYAGLDGRNVIGVEHLRAAWGLWRYCEASAAYIFGDAIGDAVADRLLAALREAHPAGLDGSQQYALFGRHVTRTQLDAARTLLEERGLAETMAEPTRGRPRLVTFAIANEANQAKDNEPSDLPSPFSLRSQRWRSHWKDASTRKRNTLAPHHALCPAIGA